MRDRRPFEGLEQRRTLASWRRENQAQVAARNAEIRRLDRIFDDAAQAAIDESDALDADDLAEDKRLDDEADRREENAS